MNTSSTAAVPAGMQIDVTMTLTLSPGVTPDAPIFSSTDGSVTLGSVSTSQQDGTLNGAPATVWTFTVTATVKTPLTFPNSYVIAWTNLSLSSASYTGPSSVLVTAVPRATTVVTSEQPCQATSVVVQCPGSGVIAAFIVPFGGGSSGSGCY